MAISTAPAQMQIVFRLTERDLYRANVAIAADNFKKPTIVLGLICIEGLAIAGLVGFVLREQSTWYMLISVGAALYFPLIILSSLFISTYFAAKSLFRSELNLQSDIRCSFSDDFVSVEMATGESKLLWTTFLKATERSAFFLLYVRKSLAYVIPKRVFASETETSTFREMLRRNVSKTSLSRSEMPG